MEDWLYIGDIFFDNCILDLMALSNINKNSGCLKEGLAEGAKLQDVLQKKQQECLQQQAIKDQIQELLRFRDIRGFLNNCVLAIDP